MHRAAAWELPPQEPSPEGSLEPCRVWAEGRLRDAASQEDLAGAARPPLVPGRRQGAEVALESWRHARLEEEAERSEAGLARWPC